MSYVVGLPAEKSKHEAFVLMTNILIEVSAFYDVRDPTGTVSPPLPHLGKKTDPVSETLCLLVSRIPDDGQSPKTQ
jgi:hypothetical protein